MNSMYLPSGAVIILWALGIGSAQAQERTQDLLGSTGQVLSPINLVDAVEIARLDPRAVGAGPFDLYGALGFEALHNDNLFLTDANTVSTPGFILAPGLRAELADNVKVLGLQYEAYLGRYKESSSSNYNDQRVLADFEYQPTDRQRLDLRAEFLDWHDPLGTGRQEGILVPLLDQGPDRWRAWGLGGDYGFGGGNARGRVGITGGYFRKRYINNKPSTLERDRDRGDLGATFFLRVQPKTSALLEATAADNVYTTATELDSKEYSALAGITWDITGKTSGTAKAGYLRKAFEAPTQRDYSGVTWNVGLLWQVRTYSAITLSTARRTRETNGTGDFILQTNAIVGWRHDWLTRFSSTLELGVANERYEPAVRDDDLADVRLLLDYRFSRWLALSGGYRFSKRDSNVPTLSYDRNIFSLGILATL